MLTTISVQQYKHQASVKDKVFSSIKVTSIHYNGPRETPEYRRFYSTGGSDRQSTGGSTVQVGQTVRVQVVLQYRWVRPSEYRWFYSTGGSDRQSTGGSTVQVGQTVRVQVVQCTCGTRVDLQVVPKYRRLQSTGGSGPYGR